MGSKNEKKSGDALPLVQLRAEFQFAAGDLSDAASSQLGDDVAPLGNGTWRQLQSFGGGGGSTFDWIEVRQYGFLEHASGYSMLKPDATDAKESLAYAAPIMQTMGDRIRQLRTARGWSQSELAGRVGVTVGAISQWELGSTKNIKLETFIKLCDELATDFHYLIFGPTRKPPPRRSGQGSI
jgi:HTH-type transcriptional regulator/antitoxin HipB